jgi:hypothetical protein
MAPIINVEKDYMVFPIRRTGSSLYSPIVGIVKVVSHCIL